MKSFIKIIIFSIWTLPAFAQLISPSAAVRMGAVPSSCIAGSSSAIVVNNAGTDEILTCDNTGHYTLPPGGSTSVLTPNGVGAAGAAGANKLTGPANVIIGTDGSGNGVAKVPNTDYLPPASPAMTGTPTVGGNPFTYAATPTVSGDFTLNPSTGVGAITKTQATLTMTCNPTGGSAVPIGCTPQQASGITESYTGTHSFAGVINIPAANVTAFTQTVPTTFRSFSGTAYGTNTFAYSGGRNFYNDKTNFNTVEFVGNKYTETQDTGMFASYYFNYGNGDSVGHQIEQFGFGGCTSAADECSETQRYVVVEGQGVWQGTLNSIATAADGSKTFTNTQTAFPGTQGEGRIVVDTNHTYNTGYIGLVQQGSADAANAIQLTITNGNLDATFGLSTKTTLSTAVLNPVSTTNSFPQSNVNMAVASSASFSVSGQVCIFDYDYECEIISAVPDSTHITVFTMRKPHPVGAWVVTGGLTGYAFDPVADNYDPNNTNGITEAPNTNATQVFHLVQPIMMSATGNLVTLFAGHDYLPGTGEPFVSRTFTQMGTGGSATSTSSAGALATISCSGGSGYLSTVDEYNNPGAPPQISFNPAQWTTVPTAHVSVITAGALTTCVIDTPGTGALSGTPTVTVTPSNPYVIYPASKVRSVYSAGVVSGVLIVDPPSGTFNTTDTLELPHYFSQTYNGSHNQVGGLFPASQVPSGGLTYFLYGPLHGTDIATSFRNESAFNAYANNPASLPSTIGQGQLNPPLGHFLDGPYNSGIFMNDPPFGKALDTLGSAAVYVRGGANTPLSGWTNGYNFLQGSNTSGGGDVLKYNPTTFGWTLTSGAGHVDGGSTICSYGWLVTGFTSNCGETVSAGRLSLTGSTAVITLGTAGLPGGSTTLPKIFMSNGGSGVNWGLNGAAWGVAAGTWANTTSTGTIASNAIVSLNTPTLTATSATTYTDSYTLYVAPPVASTNVTATNLWAAGFNGNVKVAGIAAANVVKNIPTSTDPGCAAAGDVGKQWMDSTSSVTTHFKVCSEVASTPAWVTVF